MSGSRFSIFAVLILLLLPILAAGTDVFMRLSGEGVVDDHTVLVGRPVSLDIYFANNEEERRGFLIGFRMWSDRMTEVLHIPDSGNGLNENGDVKGYNGFEDRSIWDLFGVKINPTNWDGILGDTIGLGGFNVKTRYMPHADTIKVLSFDVMFFERGTVHFDSSFFPPGGEWMFINPIDYPNWGGPYEIEVVKTAAARVPDDFTLSQNYPNPFNATTVVPFNVDKPISAAIDILNTLGQRVRTLREGMLERGQYRLVWDGTDAAGEDMPTGIYFVRMKSGKVTQVRKMALVK